MPKPSKPRDLLPRWRISIIRKKAEPLGTVSAKDEVEALARAVETYGISDPMRQRRLVARRIDG